MKRFLSTLALAGLSLFAGENLLRNGSFETSDMKEFYIRRTTKGKSIQGHENDIYTERSAFKAKDGKFSLLCSCNTEQFCVEINLNGLPYTPGKKYRYSMDYFIASAGKVNSVAGRVAYFDANDKILGYRFPNADASTGKWHTMSESFYPPVNTTRVAVTFWLGGQQQVYVDNVVWMEVDEEQSAPAQNQDACLIGETADFAFWKQAGYQKVSRDVLPQDLKKSGEVALSAAANESEPFQLVLYPKKDIPQLRLQFSDLKKDGDSKTVLPATALSYRSVDYINNKNPDNRSLLGWVADPLLEDQVMDAVKGQNRPFFVRVNVPKGQPAGVYRGTADILSGDLKLADVKLALTVRAFELPDIPELRTYFYCYATNAYMAFDKRPHGEVMDDLHRQFKELRLTGNQTCHVRPPKWEVKDGKLTITDWKDYDESVKKFMGYGFQNLPFPNFGMMGDNSGWGWKKETKDMVPTCPYSKKIWTDPESLDLAAQFINQVLAHNKQLYPNLTFYAYMYDEPPAKVRKDLAIIMDGLHERAPEFKTFIPHLVKHDIGYVHTYCVPFGPGYYNYENQMAHLASGGDVWFYNWTVNMDNHNYIRNRYFAWQIYAADGNGGLLWQTVHVHNGINPWTDMDRTYANGGATIFYPPHNGQGRAVPSQRVQEIRESIDDFDYMRILEHRIDAKYPGQGKKRVKELMGALITDIPFKFKNDQHLLYEIRNRIADEIEAFDKFPTTITSVPPENACTEFSEIAFSVFAPEGTKVKCGKASGKTDKNGCFTFVAALDKLGKNSVDIKVGKQVFTRVFELKRDPQLDELKKLAARLDEAKLDSKDIASFLQSVEKKGAYSKKERAKAAKLLDSAKTTLLQTAIKTPPAFVNALDAAMFQRAKAAFDRGQFDVAEYYIDLVKAAAAAGDMKACKVTVKPVSYQGYDGFELDNGLVNATLLETGGRLISFKVKGVECLAQGSLTKGLSPKERAARKVNSGMFLTLPDLGGYEDCSAGSVLAVSYVDWDITFADLGTNKIAIMFETDIPESPFHVKKVYSMAAKSMDLRMDYEFSNTLPVGQKSDDPAHHQFSWRGRFLPAIGADGRLNDQLDLPLEQEDALEATLFDRSKPVKYERRSVYLLKPQMSVYDQGAKTGMDIIGSAATTHAYVWFDTKNPDGVYTLEFPRSFYGKTHTDKHPNSPFYLEPGQSQSFNITIRGKHAK